MHNLQSYPFASLPTVLCDIDRGHAQAISMAPPYPSATLLEAAGKRGALPKEIKPVDSKFRIWGPAITVHSPPKDNLWLHRAMLIAQPGDVLVVYTSDFHDAGYWGEIMATAAKVKGLGGLVIDGCVRDVDLLRDIGFPVFARGLCIDGTGKDRNSTGWINYPIRIGDVAVRPGDLIVGDADGVVVVDRLEIKSVLAAARKREEDEALIIKRLTEGENTIDIYGWNF